MLKKLKQIIKSNKFHKILIIFTIQLFFILIFTFLFLLDDYIFKIFNDINKACFSMKYFYLAFGLSTSISFVKNKKIIYFLLLVFCLIELSQLVYLAYFGSYLHPVVIPLIFKEFIEIKETGLGSLGKVYYAFLSAVIPYLIMFFIIKKYNDRLFKFKFSWIILILFISLIPLRAIREVSIVKLLANPQNPSIYNGLRLYSAYIFNILPDNYRNNRQETKFEKYKLEKLKPILNKLNVVLVYGESFNYYNQHLYGYNKNTTPNLSKLSKNDKNFIFKKGIGSAVSTQQSIPVFFNLQKEPENYKMQIDMDFNLFKLAKEQGFKTFYISAQSTGLTNSIGRQYIDVFITLEDEKKLFNKMGDEALLEILKEQKLTNKNFIVLHQRNLHSPYEKNYSHKKNEFEKFESSYDNAMLYNDFVLSQIIEYFKNKSKIPFYLFITSDHNELTGQNGLYGHITLLPEGGDVPIMLYSKNTNSLIEKELKNIFRPTHFEFGLLIARIFGYKITNTNTPDNVFYINGNDSMARYGYIKVIKDLDNKTLKYQIINGDKVENRQQRF